MRWASGVRVTADGLGLRTGRGPVFGGVSFTARPGSLTAFHAESGGGRTALLLTLSGRMRPTSGTLHVDGHPLPGAAREVRRISALGLSEGVNDLDDRLRVAEHLTERQLMRLRRPRRGVTDAALEAAGLTDLDTRTLVRELSMAQRRRLGIALALLDEPRLLLVDNTDTGLRPDHQRDLWATLRALARSGPTVIATCTDPDPARDAATVLPLPRPPRPARGPAPTTPATRARRVRLSELFDAPRTPATRGRSHRRRRRERR